MMNLRTWYKGLTIPRFRDQREMKLFATSMVSAFGTIAGKTLDVHPHFILSKDIDTAAIDLKQTKVYIGLNILNVNPEERPNPKASEDSALTTIFGMVFHESMHFVYTSRKIEEIAASLSLENEQLFLMLNNICEDYYIDDVFLKTMALYDWVYEERFHYFFSVDKAREFVDGFLVEPTSANFIKVLISLKNPKSRYLLRRLAPEHLAIAKLALSAIEEHDRELRPHIAYEVYKLLLENTDKSTTEEQQEAMSDGDAEELLDNEQMNNLEKTIEIDSSMIMYNGGEDVGGIIEIVPSTRDTVSSSFGFASASSKQMNIDNRYFGFANLLKAHSETAVYWTPPSHRGRHIRSVSRIATDSKLFSTKVVDQGIGPQEILILVDCSGSMTSSQNIWKAIEASYAAASSLENARHSVAVYGHTADHDLFREVASTTLYRFKGFSEKLESVKSRFTHFFANSNGYLYNNDDEIAILEMAKRFTPTRNKKTLIVFSDGSPASHRSPDIRSTAKAVAKVRSMGIGVISISIEEDAVRTNNEIYGSEFNVDNDDPNVVIEVIRKIAQF